MMWRLLVTVYVYCETNFLMSIATGRDPQAGTLLSAAPPSVCLVIPSVCSMEALSKCLKRKT